MKKRNFFAMLTVFGMAVSSNAVVCADEAEWQSPNYSNGIFLLNEDWFGHDNASLNFYSSTDRSVYYHVYRNENPGATLGTTGAFGTIYADKVYLLSKQAAEGNAAGGRIVVADASDMSAVASVANLGGGDARALIGVNDSTAYVSTSDGVVVFDIKDNAVVGTIAGTAGSQVGDMVRVDGRIFAASQGNGVLVIDATDNSLVTTVALDDITSVFVNNEGNLYAAYNSYSGWGSADGSAAGFVKIDPYTLETTTIAMPDGMSVLNSWGTWHPGSVAFDAANSNVVYFVNKEYSPVVHRYNFATSEFIENYFALPTGEGGAQVTYGAISVDPHTGYLIVEATEEGWGAHFANNWVYLVDTSTTEIASTLTLESYYWFPSMSFFPDVALPTINISDVALDLADEPLRYKLTDVVTDADNCNAAIAVSIEDVSDATVAKPSISEGYLCIEPLACGTTSLTLSANSNGQTACTTIGISVADASQSALNSIAVDQPVPVVVCDIQGRVLVRTTATTAVDALSGLNRGIYVVHMGGKAYKVMK